MVERVVMPVVAPGARAVLIIAFQVRELHQVIVFQGAEMASLLAYPWRVYHQVVLQKVGRTKEKIFF